ncbi:hypothetical protein DINM_005818 [Dirofilaria immitis]|nr:hypothetical protein [Dirofilaria immitis]
MDIPDGIVEWHDIVSPLFSNTNRNKRKSPALMTVPKEAKIPKKIAKESISDVSDDIEIAQSSSVDLHFSPSQIAKIVQEFPGIKSENETEKENWSKKFLGFSDFDDINMPPGGTKEMLKTDLRRCLKEAVILSTMTIPTALELLHSFLEEGHSVTMDPTFPKKPPNAFSIFMRKTGHSRFSSSSGSALALFTRKNEVSAFWHDESNAAEKAEAKKEALQLMEKYLLNLQAYRSINRKELKRVIEVGNPLRKRNRKALSIFLQSAWPISKYVDLEPEKRMKRLRKKFDRLSEAEREIYNNLAAAL